MKDRSARAGVTLKDDLDLAEAEAEALEAAAAAAAARARVLRLRGETASADDDPGHPELDSQDLGSQDEAGSGREAEAAEDERESGVASEPVTRARHRRWRKPVGAAIAVAITVAMIAASAVMTIEHRRSIREQQQAAEYTAAARQGVTSLMSLNFAQAQDDVQRIIDNSTGQFRSDFESSAADFAEVAEQSQVVTDATVNATAIQRMSDQDATVLVSVTSRITNKEGAQEDPRTWRLSVDVARDGDQVKMAKVDFVP